MLVYSQEKYTGKDYSKKDMADNENPIKHIGVFTPGGGFRFSGEVDPHLAGVSVSQEYLKMLTEGFPSVDGEKDAESSRRIASMPKTAEKAS